MVTLIEALKIASETESFSLSKIKIPEEQYFYYRSLINPNLVFAINKVSNKQVESAKNSFYKAGIIAAYQHDVYEKGNYTDSIYLIHRYFCYVILSDSSKLINHYLKYNDNFLKTFQSAFVKAVQAIIKNDDDELFKQIDLLEKYTAKKTWEKDFNGVFIAFKGILQNDKVLVEQGINEILAKHSKQEQPAVVKDYMNIEALTLAKLAYRKGIIVEIDNPLLPKEMIPIQELEKYESYDFLRDLEAAL
jgi:hypothetical protein